MKKTAQNQEVDIKESAWALSAEELAERLGLSLRHVRRLDATGKLPRPLKLGGSVRWLVKEINRWLEAGAPDRIRWEAMKKEITK